MNTIFLCGSDYETAQELHASLKLLLNLPEYYGGNADALHDCLSERVKPIRVYIADSGNSEVAAALRKVALVVTDLGGEVLGDAVQL